MQFTKDLSPSNLGLTNMNDKYLTIRNSLKISCGDADLFYGPATSNKGIQIPHIDKNTGKEYMLRYTNGKEIRLYQLREYFDDTNPSVGDEILVEKEITENGVLYYIDLIKNNKNKIVKHKKNKRYNKGQGFNTNKFSRKAIEMFAMNKTRAFLEKNGWRVTDTSNIKPYDFEALKNKELKFIEVKGTTGEGKDVILTHGEVNHVKDNNNKCAIYVIGNIVIEKITENISNDDISEGLSLGTYDKINKILYKGISGDLIDKRDPWLIDDNDLTATQFRYKL